MFSDDFARRREKLIERELRPYGMHDEAVLKALARVPREAFVPEHLREFAYRNSPLPIGCGQTISQPLVVAEMAAALKLGPHDRVLEVGAGSGYAAAVLSLLAREVYAIEWYGELADGARQRLLELGYDNVQVKCGDGTLGWPEHAPFDAISVAAGSPSIPPALLEQLAIGGRLVIPIGADQESQELVRAVRRSPKAFDYEELGAVRFVPLLGEGGWNTDE